MKLHSSSMCYMSPRLMGTPNKKALQYSLHTEPKRHCQVCNVHELLVISWRDFISISNKFQLYMCYSSDEWAWGGQGEFELIYILWIISWMRVHTAIVHQNELVPYTQSRNQGIVHREGIQALGSFNTDIFLWKTNFSEGRQAVEATPLHIMLIWMDGWM